MGEVLDFVSKRDKVDMEKLRKEAKRLLDLYGHDPVFRKMIESSLKALDTIGMTK